MRVADVISIEKTNEHFRMLYDVRGRFAVHRVSAEEAKVRRCATPAQHQMLRSTARRSSTGGARHSLAQSAASHCRAGRCDPRFFTPAAHPRYAVCSVRSQYKLCRIKALEMGPKKVPYVVTHDGRTIRYPDPSVKVNDTVKVDIESNKIEDFVKFETGNLAMINGGKNTGRVGVIISRERHQGSFDIVHLKDSTGHMFATRLGNVFVIGEGTSPMVSLPKRKGIKKTIIEERNERPPKGA